MTREDARNEFMRKAERATKPAEKWYWALQATRHASEPGSKARRVAEDALNRAVRPGFPKVA